MLDSKLEKDFTAGYYPSWVGSAKNGKYSYGIAEDDATYACAVDATDKLGHQGKLLRLAMELIEGTQTAAGDRKEQADRLRSRMAAAAGHASPSLDSTEVRQRVKSLAREADRGLAEQLQLLLRIENEQLYKEDGCRSMVVWMGVHLRIGDIAASERLRVGRSLEALPILASLFSLGRISFSQLRFITRYATSESDAEFALAAIELSVRETKAYCERFRHLADLEQDVATTALAGQEAAMAQAALRAFQRRSLSIIDVDAHSTRITLELPKDLAAEFIKSLEESEDWLQGESDFDKPTPRQRRADAAVHMSRRSLAHAGEAVAMADRYRVHATVDARLLGGVEFADNERYQLAPPERPQLQGHGPISQATARRMAEMAGFTLYAVDQDGEVLGYQKKAAPFTRRQLDALHTRDQCCQMPGCGATRHLVGHHKTHREHGGTSTLANGITLCSSCHRLLHEGGFRLQAMTESDNGTQLEKALATCQATTDQAATDQVAGNGSTNIALSKVFTRVRSRLSQVRRFRLLDAHGHDRGNAAAAPEDSG